MDSIAKQVGAWIKERPYIAYALKKNFINFSSLTREIQKDLKIKNFDAVIAAVRRYRNDVKILKHSDKEIMDIIRKSRLEVKTGINVYILRKSEEIKKEKYSHFISGTNSKIIITHEKLNIPVIKKYENVIEVTIISPADVEDTAGFISYVMNSLSEKEINVIEAYSCFTDTIFICEKKYMQKVVESLESIGIV